MKKEELMALGLDTETIKEIQRIHGNDMQNLRKKLEMNGMNDLTKLRGAIVNMLPMLNERTSLLRILSDITYLYHSEAKNMAAKKKEENMAYYVERETCGAKLDPGEKCDCTPENESKTANDAEKEESK